MIQSKKKVNPANMITIAGFPLITKLKFTASEVETLRGLAKKVAEIAVRPLEKKKAALWTKHNDLEEVRPLIFADPENGWNEIILSDSLECNDPLARVWEMYLRKQIFWAENIKDDKVIEAYFDVPYCYSDTGWGIELKKEGGEDGGAYHIIPPIKDYEEDFPKLKFPEIVIDYKSSDTIQNLAKGVLGDILIVRRKTNWWWTLGMTCDFITLRGLDNFMLDLILYPEWVHKLMAFLRDGYLNRLDFLEKNGLLASNTEGAYVGSGGFGWTTQLPIPKEIQGNVKTMDMWGFTESQETVGVSPEMFGEFILPYQTPIMERFGLNCYGCCEPIDPRWDYVKQIPRLRRVSASPWSNKKFLAEDLGRNYIISAKPSPTPLSRPHMDEDEVRKEIKSILQDTKGCVVELIMKDNHTLGGNPQNIVRWVEIAREEIENLKD